LVWVYIRRNRKEAEMRLKFDRVDGQDDADMPCRHTLASCGGRRIYRDDGKDDFEVGQRQLSADEKESDASKEELPHALENLGILVREGEMGRRRLRLSMVRVRRISRFCCETS
jgi:hypothetical protein